jgi:hypothetical protein
VDPSETAAANSLNTLMRSIGTSTASAVAGVILAQMTTLFGPTPLPSENGFKAVMAVGSGAAVLALLVAAFIPRRALPVPDSKAAGAGAKPAAGGTRVRGQVREADGAPAGERTGGSAVRGCVRGADGAGVARAAVTLVSLGGRQLGRTVAAEDGGYAVDAPGEGTYVLVASAGGRRPTATTVVVGAHPVSHDLLLTGTSRLAGVVRAADSGAPVAGAVVIVTDVRGEVLATERTDGLGEFSLTGLVPGTVTVAVSAPKHRPLALPVEIDGSQVTRVEAELRPGARVRGTIRGAGGPLGDARVTLVDAAGNVVATTTTGDDGAYAFSDLDGGQYTVIASGYPPRAAGVTVNGDGADDHDIELAHPGA